MEKTNTILASLLCVALIMACGISYGCGARTVEPTPEVEEAHLIYMEADLALTGNAEHLTIEGEVGIFNRPKVVKWSGEDYYLTYTTMLGETTNLATVLKNGKVAWQYKCTSEIGNPFSIADVTLRPDSVVIMVQEWGIYEIDYRGNLLYSLPIDRITHQATVLPNGNFLIVRTDYDQVAEVNREGEMVWEWNALKEIKDYGEDTYNGWYWQGVQNFHNPSAIHREGCPDNPVVWTHVNGVQKLEDGWLICLRNLDLIIKVNENSEVVWSFGSLILKHPHCARIVDGGNLLVYDNGNGRVAEYKLDGTLVWQYTGLDCPALGWCQKLWNGNYLFPDTMGKRILEVTPGGEIVKEIHTADILYQAKAQKLDINWLVEIKLDINTGGN